ncbi:hypothetical protein RI367_005067 [Sorochytrium milnesiophthora]
MATYVLLSGTPQDKKAVLTFPMSEDRAAFTTCRVGSGNADCGNRKSQACGFLDACTDSNCAYDPDHQGGKEYCVATKCSQSYTQCYGSYCLPWDDSQLLKHNITIDTSQIDGSLATQVQQYQAVLGNSTARDAIISGAQNSNLSIGICVIAPPISSPCSGADNIASIDQWHSQSTRANTMPIAISATSPAIAGVKHSTVSMPPSPAAPYASSPVDSLTPAGGVAAGQHRGSHSNISVAGMSAISGDMHLASPSIATTDSYGDTDYEYDYADDYGDNGFDDDDDDGKRSVASAETSKTAGSASSATAKRGFFGRKKLSPEEKAERAEQKRLKKEEKERELKKLLLTPGGLGTIRMGGL